MEVMMRAIVYLPLKPDVAKRLNLPLKLPVLAEDLLLINEMDKIPLDVIVRGLEAQYNVEKSEYWLSYLIYFYYEKFKEQLNLGNYEEAASFLDRVKAIRVDYRYHFYSGILQSKLGNYELAEIELKQCVSMNPNFAFGHYELGNVLFIKKDYDEAVESYKNAIQVDGSFLLPLMKIGDVYTELGQLDDAEVVYNMVVSKSKNLQVEGFTFEPIVEAYLRLGVVYNLRGKYEKAERVFKEGLEIVDKPELRYNLAYSLMKLGKHFEAYALLLNLSREYPTPEVLNELGILQRRLGFYDEAMRTFQSVRDDFPENYDRILYFVGVKRYNEDFNDDYARHEEKLLAASFPFPSELELLLRVTDDDGNVIVERLLEELGRTVDGEKLLVGVDNLSPDMEYVPLILAAIYVAGADPIVMEKNATLTTVATYGAGLALACSTLLLRLYQFVLKNSGDTEEFIEETYPEIDDLHHGLAVALRSLLEAPLEDFSIVQDTYDSFVLALVKAIGYGPTADEIERIESRTLRETVRFFLKLQKGL